MNKIFHKIKYPKLLVLLLTFALAYLLFSGRDFLPLDDYLMYLGYFGTFLAGMLFTYGFTAAPATAILLILAKEQNIVLAGLIGGFGALIGDLIIFRFVRDSFADEFKKLSKEKFVQNINNKAPNLLKKYFAPAIAGFIIASPLPDVLGVSLLAASKTISMKTFSVIAYLLNTAGIFVVLMIGSSI